MKPDRNAQKYLPLVLFAGLWFSACNKLRLDLDSNCLNEKSACYKKDKTAPQLSSSTPPAGSVQSLLPTIQLDFSEEIKDATNTAHYVFSGLGAANLTVVSATRVASNSVLITTGGKVSSGAIYLNLVHITDYAGNPLTGTTVWAITGNVQIPVVVTNADHPGVSNIGGGYSTVNLTWHHEYDTDVNNEYAIWVTQAAQPDCATFWANKATNAPLATASPLTAFTDTVTGLPVANFSLGANVVLICVRNLGQNKFGQTTQSVVRDDSKPVSSASPGTTSSGTPVSVTLSCTDNADKIAYTVDGAVPVFTAGAITTGSLYTGPWSVPNDATAHTLRWLCIDKGGNVEVTSGSAVYLYDPTLPTVSIAAITRTNVSTGGYTSTQITWSADQSPRTYSLRKDGTCSLSGSDLTGASFVAGTYSSGLYNTIIPASALTAGVNSIRLCVYNNANTNPGYVSFNLTQDNSAPTIAAANIIPADGATNVAAGAAITINFPEAMDATTLTTATNCTGSISISTDNFVTCIAGTLNVSLNPSVTFAPTGSLAYLSSGGRYKVRVTTAAKDLAGNALAAAYTQTTGFTVAITMLRRYSFDNGSLVDLVGSGYDFTPVNSPATATGADGDSNGAFALSGGQYLVAPDTGLPAAASPRTLCAWVNPNSYPATGFNSVFAVYGNALTTNDRFGIGGRNVSNANQVCLWVDNINRCANYTLPLKSWSHVCGVYDGTNISIYANGVRIFAPTAVPLATALSSLRSGVFFDLTSPFDGKIDDLRIYNGDLTASQIQQLAVQVPSGLMAYYPFSDVPAATTLDVSGNARNGTLSNSPAAVADYFSAGNYAYNFTGLARIAAATQVPMGTTNGAIAAWVRWGGSLPGADQVIAYNGNTGSKGFGLMLDATYPAGAPSNLSVLCGGNTVTDFGYQLRPGTWTHIVLQTGTAGTWQLYINGIQIYNGGGCFMAAADSGQVLIGNNEVGDRPFLGDIDDVRVYNRTLSTNEIQVLAAQNAVPLVRQYAFAAGNLADSLTGGYTLSAAGSPLQANGIDADSGGAYRFDATSNYLTTTQMNQLPLGNNPRTFCSFIQPANYISTHYTAVSYGGTSGNDPQGLAISGTSGYATYHYGAGISVISAVSVPLNSWSHLCGVYDGTTITVYLNGAAIGSGTPGTLTTTAGQFQVASWAVLGASAFPGKVDDVRVYYGALSAPQIRSAGILVPNGLVAYLPFTSRSLTDDTNNGHGALFSGSMSTANAVADRNKLSNMAYNFNGNTHALKASDSGLPSGTADSTQCVMVRTKAYPSSGAFAGLVSYGKPATGQRRGLMLFNNGGTQQVSFTGYANDYAVNYTMPLNTWTHICGTYSAGTATLYINGVRFGSGPVPGWNTALGGGIWIGSGQQPTESYYFNGDLDDIRIYNRVLSQAEIQVISGLHPMQVSAPASDFRFHLQADNYSSLTDGATVTAAWQDGSRAPLGNGTVISTPLYNTGTNGIGGRDVVTFPNLGLAYFDFGTPSITMNGLTLCGVYSVAASASVWGAIVEKRGAAACNSGGDGVNPCTFAWLNVQFTSNTKFETAENTTPNAIPTSANVPSLACIVASGTTAQTQQYQFGNSIGYGATGTPSLGNNATNNYSLAVGKRTISSEYFYGKIGDLLLYTSPLGTTDRQLVECYLSSKYSLPLASGVLCP